MAQANLSFGQIVGRMAALFRANPLPAILAYLALVAPSAAIDAYGGDPRLDFFVSIISVFAQYGVTFTVLRRERMLDGRVRAGRAASFIGLGIVTGLAILLGCVLLILPGLYLAARWSIGAPLVIGEGATMGEAMSRSWARTQGSVGPIMGLIVICFLPYVAAVAFAGLLGPMLEGQPLIEPIVSNALVFLSPIANWYAALAIHALTRPRADTGELADVFA